MQIDEERLFETHFRGYAGRVHAFALRRAGPEVAQDVTAETFLVAWRRRAEMPPEPLPWLYGIARGVLANERRTSNRRLSLAARIAAEPASPHSSGDSDHEVLQALASLRESDREALLLSAWEGLSTKEAASVVGCSAATFAVRLHRARRRLARTLGEPRAEADEDSQHSPGGLPMTARQDPLERVRNANPVPTTVEPDWEQITEHVTSGSRESFAVVRGHGVDRTVDRGRGVGRTVLGGLALCIAVTTIVLVALAPWSDSSDSLARAAAALTPPGAGSVLYERWEHIIAPEPGNPGDLDGAMFGPEQLWVEGAYPHRYRAVLEPDDNVSYDSTEAAGLAFTYGVDVGYSGDTTSVLDRLPRELAGRPLELGGKLEAPASKAHPHIILPTLTFVPPNRLFRARLQVALGATLPGPHDQAIEKDPDPVSVLRAAITEGRAHEAGITQREGLSLLRIDLDLPTHLPADAPPLPANAAVFHTKAHAYAYVEPETFRPIEIVFGRDTYRFLAYEYLPASAANRALTDIRAQHPTAVIAGA